MASDAYSAKRALRAEIRQRRRIATATERTRDAEGHTARLIELAERLDAKSVATYLSMGHEPDTRGFLAWTKDRGIQALLPISRDDGLLDWAPYDAGIEERDIHGMLIPTSELLGPIAINDVDLILAPASAIDLTGMRMGWGRGYFDRTLGSMASRPPVYAVIFDHELLDEVPHDEHDERLDGVVTPTRILTF